MLTRAQFLGQLMDNYAKSIAVSGTHGKTTTTSMISHILLEAKTDPTISVGGMLEAIGGNIRVGGSDVFLTEACEYTNSFLNFHPKYSIILNIEEDHMDFFKDINDKYMTLPELLKEKEEKEAEAKDENTDDNADNTDEQKDTRETIYYVTDKNQQGQYIRMFKESDMNAVILDHNIDTSFITQLEQRNQNYKFMRIDADVTDALKEEVSEEEMKSALDTLTETFRAALGKENLDVKVEKLKDASISSMITLSEEGRRMQDMMKMYNMYGMDPSMFGGNETLILNVNNKLVQYILDHKNGEHVPMFCKQLYDLALLSNQPLSPEAMTAFINRSNEVMMILADK